MKFAVVSHILPPSPSGQAMVLYRLLKDAPTAGYCLISREDYSQEAGRHAASRRLSGSYHTLMSTDRMHVVRRFKLYKPTFVLNTFWQILDRARQIRDIVRTERCEVIIACTGDLHDLPAASLAGRWTGVPVILYLFDDYLYQWTGFTRAIARTLEPLIIKRARAIIVPNEFMMREYLGRHGVNSTVIHNPCDLFNLKILDGAHRIFDDQETAIVYTGAVYHAHYDAFRNLIHAMEQIRGVTIRLHIFTAQSENELRQNGLYGPRIVYHGHIPQSDIPNVLYQADVLFLPLAFDSPIPEVIRSSAPGKTGEYLASGRPILVHAPNDTFISWYFKHHKCGVVVDSNDSAMLARELDRILSDEQARTNLGKRARERAEIDFSTEVMSAKFRALVSSAIGEAYA